MPGGRKRGGPPAGQQSLFPGWSAPPPPDVADSPLATLPPIDSATTLTGLALPYRNYLLLHDHTTHTVDCFLSDLRLLTRFVGVTLPVGAITRDRIVDWLMHLRWGSSERPAPKTMARRVTFLKNFFGWLAEDHVLPDNIAATISFARPLPPLPELLFENEIERLVSIAAGDPRSSLLVMLALDAGLKKEEILQLGPEHVDVSDPERPTIAVRLIGQSRPQRERMLALPPDFTPVYERYLHVYRPQGPLFNCTDRNLTYILARVAKRARLTKRVTLQLLRDCFAVRELRNGLPLPALREKLGLSDEAWYEAQEKYRKLAFPV